MMGVRARVAADTTALPRRWPWLFRGFRKYCSKYARKHFHGVRIAKSGLPPTAWEGPAVIVANHPSWWDPIVMFILSGLWPDRVDYGPIEAAALKHYKFLGKVGLFGIETGSPRGAIEFLRTARAIVANDSATLWITAQGLFTDVRARPLKLRGGVGHLAAEMSRGVLIPLALEYPFWDERTPEALVAFGEPIRVDEHPGISAKEWTALLESRLEATQDRLATDSQTRDPSHFHDLVRGKTGVGGIYDLWRRTTATLTGRRFQADHAAVMPRRPPSC